MGNRQNIPHVQPLLNKYNYVCELNTTQQHKGSLYRKKTENYDYLIVMISRILEQVASSLQAELTCINACKNVIPMLKIHYFSIQDEVPHQSAWKGSCFKNQGEYKSLIVCQQYANYSLKEHIAFKNKLRQSFTLKEYVYAIKAAVQIAMVLITYEFHYLEFDLSAQHLFITANGELKLSAVRSRSFQAVRQECYCWNQPEEQSNYGGMNEKREVIRLKKGVKSRRQMFMKQIKQLACSMVHYGPSSAKQTEKYAKQIRALHESAIKTQQLEQLNKLLSPLQDDFFLIGPDSARVSLLSDNQKLKIFQEDKQRHRSDDNRMKLQLHLKQKQSAIDQFLQSEPTIASPCHALPNTMKHKKIAF